MLAPQMPEPLGADIGESVLAQLRRMGLEPFPTNYAVVYEALSGTNPALVEAMAALDPMPGQEAFDRMAERCLGRDRGHAIVESAHASIAHKLDEILDLLRAERNALEKYGHLLSSTSQGLRIRDTVSQDFLKRVVTVMSSATDSARDNGRRIAARMEDKSAELATVKAELEQYKKLSETDALTDLKNRRAFDTAIAELYRSPTRTMFGALILADIDRFKPVNDRYGHPIGDRILQIVASIFKAGVSDNVLVARTGGEEFGVIVEGMSEAAVVDFANEIRLTIEQTPFVNARTGTDYGPITLSFGVCMAAEAKTADELYRKCDRALYASKSSGRNRVTAHSGLREGGFTKNWLLYAQE